jgi:DNA-3-methyladenine glycosylase
MGRTLARDFFSRDTVTVARDLIGNDLVRTLPEDQLLRGVIVETEAYRGSKDPASHAFRGVTERNRVMFGPAGFAYVYFTYGFHFCLNVVTGEEGVGAAVLIRALEPVQGLEVMRGNRKFPPKDRDLTSGPGKICQAFSINKSLNGIDMTLKRSPLRIEIGSMSTARKIIATPRIGIRVATEKYWRFLDANSPFVSKREHSKSDRSISP